MLWAPVDLFLGSTVGFFYFLLAMQGGVRESLNQYCFTHSTTQKNEDDLVSFQAAGWNPRPISRWRQPLSYEPLIKDHHPQNAI